MTENKILGNNDYELWNGDCLELMKNISDNSIDCIICDLPYGTTKLEWDTIIDFDLLWSEYNRVLKDNANEVYLVNIVCPMMVLVVI